MLKYYTSDAILTEKMVFSVGKTFPFRQEILFKCYNTPWWAKIGTYDIMLQYRLCHFQTSEKPKMDSLINVIYKLIYHLFLKYGKYIPGNIRII